MTTPSTALHRRPSGFTMIELIMTLVIVGIMAVVALPRMDMLRGFDEIGYRDKVKATLEYARKSAVAQRRNVRVSLAGNNLALTIDNDIPEGAATNTFPRALALPVPDRACGGAPNQICAPAAGVTLAGPAAISFSPLGQPAGPANCPAGTPVNFCFTVTGDAAHIITVEAETGYVH